MTSFRRDPYLWIHLAGLAVVPFWLDVCFASFAASGPGIPPWLELGALGVVGAIPILWMQWQRPFYVFSLLIVAVQPAVLSEDRRRLLSLQQAWSGRLLCLMSAIGLLAALIFLYRLAPIAAPMTPLAGQPRAIAWLLCAIAFLLANLFVQVPASVVPLLITSAETFQNAQPYEPASILKEFTVIGLRVPRILPELVDNSRATAAQADPSEQTTTDSPTEDKTHQEPVQEAGDDKPSKQAEEEIAEVSPSNHTDVPAQTEARETPVSVEADDAFLQDQSEDAVEETKGSAISEPASAETVHSLDDVLAETERLSSTGEIEDKKN